MKPLAPILMLVLWTLVLAGCSSEPQRYDEISDLASAVDSSGVRCDEIEPGPEAQLVAESGTCAGSEVTLFLFEDLEDLEDWRNLGARLGPTLIGSNWAVIGRERDLDRISSEVGGDVVTTDR